MKKYAFFGVVIALLLTLIGAVFYLLWEFQANSEQLPKFVDANTAPAITQEATLNDWRQELAQWPVKNFAAATEEYRLYFDADTSELKEKSKYFQLVISKYDVYSMYCLRQTLNTFDVKYFLLNVSESPEIFIDTGNLKLIEDIQKELKKYNINTEFKEIWL